jgi:hypothetical protein
VKGWRLQSLGSMSNTSTDPPSAPGGQYKEAIESYRMTARWVVSSFGAVAAAFVAGVPLSSLGQLHGWRLILAIASIFVIFGAIFLIVTTAVPMLSPVRGSYREFDGPTFALLRKDLERDDEPLHGKAATAQELADRYQAALGRQAQAWAAYEEHSDDPLLTSAFTDAKETADELYEVIVPITWLGLVLNAKQQFSKVMRTVYGAIGFAVIGAIAFAYLANPPAKSASSNPTNVHVTVNAPKVSVNESKTCVDLYLALDQLARKKPSIGSHWPTHSLGAQDQACGFRNVQELARFLSFLSHH